MFDIATVWVSARHVKPAGLRPEDWESAGLSDESESLVSACIKSYFEDNGAASNYEQFHVCAA
jgi:hypothetical protein